MSEELTVEQHDFLLSDLNPNRVASRKQAGRNLSYLEAWDVRATLIQVFGFGGWSAEVMDSFLMFEEQNEKGQWQVGYKVTLKLSIPSLGCTYSEAAVGGSSLPQRSEAHDMAVKTAESDALKRAAMNLGTQFGLSLYNNGAKKDVVRRTLVAPDGANQAGDIEVGVSAEKAAAFLSALEKVENEEQLRALYESLKTDNLLEEFVYNKHDGRTFNNLIAERLAELRD